MARLTSWGVVCTKDTAITSKLLAISQDRRMPYPDHIAHNTMYESVAYLDADRLLQYCKKQFPNSTFEIQGVRL